VIELAYPPEGICTLCGHAENVHDYGNQEFPEPACSMCAIEGMVPRENGWEHSYTEMVI